MKTTANKIISDIQENGRMPCFEIDDSVIYLEAQGDKIAVGTVCNAGLLTKFKAEVDPDLSVDANLEGIYEEALEYFE